MNTWYWGPFGTELGDEEWTHEYCEENRITGDTKKKGDGGVSSNAPT